MNIILIRHFKTKGNITGRYIGTTDEPLDVSCLPGKEALAAFGYPKVMQVVASPMCRCVETARYIYPMHVPRIQYGLEECDFGSFENKNYQELVHDPDYQAWVDSGGRLPFPKGESREAFQKRCVTGFDQAVERLIAEGMKSAAFIVHGGTIMTVMEAYGDRKQGFYDRQVSNGHGFVGKLKETSWMKGRKCIEEEKRL